MIARLATSKLLLALIVNSALVHLGTAPRNVMAAPPAPTNDPAARNQILGSQSWRQAMEGFNEWLSAQAIYSRNQLPQVRAQIAARIEKMSVRQLQDYLQDMQQKLVIINSQAAFKAQANTLYNLNVASDAYAAKLRMELPNLATMTAEQVKQRVFDLQQQENDTRADEAAFQQSNAQEVARIQALNRQTADANAAAEAAMSSSFNNNSNSGLYAPRAQPQYNPAPIATGWLWPW